MQFDAAVSPWWASRSSPAPRWLATPTPSSSRRSSPATSAIRSPSAWVASPLTAPILQGLNGPHQRPVPRLRCRRGLQDGPHHRRSGLISKGIKSIYHNIIRRASQRGVLLRLSKTIGLGRSHRVPSSADGGIKFKFSSGTCLPGKHFSGRKCASSTRSGLPLRNACISERALRFSTRSEDAPKGVLLFYRYSSATHRRPGGTHAGRRNSL